MTDVPVHQLQNKHWQIGILPKVGASIAYGRVRYGGVWIDVMRPTSETDYDNPSLSSSFVMIPWSNRIREGKIHFHGTTHQLSNLKPDGTAMHGDVRDREFKVIYADEITIRMQLKSTDFNDINFPYKFVTEVEYRLFENDFFMSIRLKNIDHQEYPAGFGFHPYFVRGEGSNSAQVQVPCDMYYELQHALPITGIPQPVPDELDFRQLRPLSDIPVDDVFTSRKGSAPAKIVYPDWNLRLDMNADDIYKHFILFSPKDKPFFALEPITNTNDGFNLYDRGVADTGVFLLKPGQERQGTVRLRVHQSTT